MALGILARDAGAATTWRKGIQLMGLLNLVVETASREERGPRRDAVDYDDDLARSLQSIPIQRFCRWYSSRLWIFVTETISSSTSFRMTRIAHSWLFFVARTPELGSYGLCQGTDVLVNLSPSLNSSKVDCSFTHTSWKRGNLHPPRRGTVIPPRTDYCWTLEDWTEAGQQHRNQPSPNC